MLTVNQRNCGFKFLISVDSHIIVGKFMLCYFMLFYFMLLYVVLCYDMI